MVGCVVIGRKSSGKCGRQHTIHDAPRRGCKAQFKPNRVEAKILFCSFRAFPNFALLIVISSGSALNDNKIKLNSIRLIKFVYQSLTSKQNLNFLESSSYRKDFLFEIENNENAVDIRKF